MTPFDRPGQIDNVRNQVLVNNPFTYGVPLKSEKKFFDRKVEMNDSIVFCKQIGMGKPGGILVLGGRGAGKSSFLQILKSKLKSQAIPSIVIPLDEQMVEKENVSKLFKFILQELTSAFSDMYEPDNHDNIWNRLRRIIIGDEEAEREFNLEIPGIKFILKQSKTNELKELDYVVLLNGLKDLYKLMEKEGKNHGAIVMLDEGDLLLSNKTLLQVLRNVFQQFDGIGLVVAGTSRLLEQVNEVFSPIPRFFKKIELRPFPGDEDIAENINSNLSEASTALSKEKISVEFKHSKFDSIVSNLTGRSPLEANLISYYAYELGTKTGTATNGKFIVKMRVDEKVLSAAISQLRGTKEYTKLLDDFSQEETEILQMLARFQVKVSSLELAVLRHTKHELIKGKSILDALKIDSTENAKIKQEIQALTNGISLKGDKLKINVLSQAGTNGIEIEDQWVRAYNKYGGGDPSRDFDSTFGAWVFLKNLKIFGDPISTLVFNEIINGIEPKLNKSIGSEIPGGWNINTYSNDGASLRIAQNMKALNCVYLRSLDNIPYHIAFQTGEKSDLKQERALADQLLREVQKVGLISKFDVKEVHDKWSTKP